MKASETKKQAASRDSQNAMYMFPYHHLVDFNPVDGTAFRQHKVLKRGFIYASYLIYVLQMLDNVQFQSIIDIGCGDGFFTRKVKEKFPARKVIGIDSSEQAIAQARVLNADKNVSFIQKNIVTDALSAQYDCATLIEVLEHIPIEKVDTFIRAIYELLGENATLIITVPSINLPIKHISRHFQHFTADSLRQILEHYFYLDTVEYIDKENKWSRRIISKVFENSYFILNSDRLINSVFQFYFNHFLHARENDGCRLIAVCRKKRNVS
ncbi:MAG: class I SAM-dependent methyltransferase [Candidatus Kerfeldbacteria bacterium]